METIKNAAAGAAGIALVIAWFGLQLVIAGTMFGLAITVANVFWTWLLG